MRNLFVVRIGIVIESHENNPEADWGDTNVFEEELKELEEKFPEFGIIDIAVVRELKEEESINDALYSLI